MLIATCHLLWHISKQKQASLQIGTTKALAGRCRCCFRSGKKSRRIAKASQCLSQLVIFFGTSVNKSRPHFRSEPPRRWLAGADAVSEAERKAGELLKQANAYRNLSSSLAHQ